VARHIQHHEAHTSGREKSGRISDGEEAGGALKGHREHSTMAEEPRGRTKARRRGDQPHLDYHGALPLSVDEGGKRLIRAELRLQEGDRGLWKARCRRKAQVQLIDWVAAVAEGDGAGDGWSVHDGVHRLPSQPGWAGRTHWRACGWQWRGREGLGLLLLVLVLVLLVLLVLLLLLLLLAPHVGQRLARNACMQACDHASMWCCSCTS
jgi:hypothetical protein